MFVAIPVRILFVAFEFVNNRSWFEANADDHEKKLVTIPFYFMPFLAEDLKNGSFKID